MSGASARPRPLRVAVVGSGPSGFFTIERLQKRHPGVEIDMFDRLPTPFGLVRGGVAPDHPNIKSVTRVFDRLARHAGFRFFGNVTIGRDVAHEDLAHHYHAVVYATGAPSDRRLRIPGETLPGVHSATEFVGWYNGHPDYRDLSFDLSRESVVIVGVGNVALDVARILATGHQALAKTDIAPHALEALRESRVRTTHVLGRRGPAQAAFTNAELRELGELPEADLLVAPGELVLDQASRTAVAGESEDSTVRKNLATLEEFARRVPAGRPRQIRLRFLVSPVEIRSAAGINTVTLVRNRLEPCVHGVQAVPTDATQTIRAGLVFRSVGCRGEPVPDLPFDPTAGVIPNDHGRVLASVGNRELRPGVYVAGWIKRGPTGVIGTNKPDAHASADALLEDFAAGRLRSPRADARIAIAQLLEDRSVATVSYEDWQRLDEIEQARGREAGRPRIKFCRIEEMLAAVGATRPVMLQGSA